MNKYAMSLTLAGLIAFGAMIPASADSLWSDNSNSSYSGQKSFKVLDIVNVIVTENSSAKNLSKTKTSVQDDLSAKLTHTISRLAPLIGTSNSANGSYQNQYNGDGATNRGTNVSARISAVVTEILPNGNLAIKGEHRVQVNDELQEIIITGVVRPKDITAGNTIYSYNVANVELSVKGSGSVSEAGNPGWITRFLNWIF